MVIDLAWQHLRRRPRRFVAAAGAIGASVMLVLVAAGLYLGLLDAIVRWPRTLPGELVVLEAGGSATLLHSASQLSRAAARAVRAVPGVERVEPLFGRLAWLERGGRQALVFLVGVDPRRRFGGPVHRLAGKARPGVHDVIVDAVLAHDLRLRLGDALRVGPATLRVAGIAAGGNAVVGSYAFVHRGTLGLGGVQRPSYLFVGVAPGADAARVGAAIDAIPGLRAVPREAFRAANQALTRQVVLPLVVIVVAMSALVGGIIVALTLYMAMVEQRADYGLLRAVGVADRRVVGLALAQGALATAAGVALGVAAGWAMGALVARLEPRFVTLMPPWLVCAVAIGALAVGAAAAVAPARAVVRIDPGSAFRV